MMAITSGFFNSVNGDRRYKADFFAEYFASFIANGVFPNPSTGMQVIANGNMTVSIRSGKAWIKGYYVNNDADYLLSLGVADGVLKRIDRIVLRLDFSSRQITPVVKKGTAASSPTAPSLQRDADAYELGLADVLISNGAISISQANITDTRLNTAFCGIVHGVVDQVDTTTIFNQYKAWFNEFSLTKQSEFNTWKSVQESDYTTWTTAKINEFNSWFTSIQDILSGDVAGNLLSKITQIENDLAAHKADYVKHPAFAVATGTANTYSVTLNPAPVNYVDGMGIAVAININSSAPSTLNVNGLGAKSIKKANGNNVTNLKANGVYTLRYKSGNFILQGEGGEYGTATAADVLTGKTIGGEDGLISGTIPVFNTGTFTPKATDTTISTGYYSGVKINGDANLKASNIVKGTSVFGVAGSTAPNPFTSLVFTNEPPSDTVYGVTEDGEFYLSASSTAMKKVTYKGILLETYTVPGVSSIQWFCEERYCLGAYNGWIRTYDKNGTLLSSNQDGSFKTSGWGESLMTYSGDAIFGTPSANGNYLSYIPRNGSATSVAWGVYTTQRPYVAYNKSSQFGRIMGFGGSSSQVYTRMLYDYGTYLSARNISNSLFYYPFST